MIYDCRIYRPDGSIKVITAESIKHKMWMSLRKDFEKAYKRCPKPKTEALFKRIVAVLKKPNTPHEGWAAFEIRAKLHNKYTERQIRSVINDHELFNTTITRRKRPKENLFEYSIGDQNGELS